MTFDEVLTTMSLVHGEKEIDDSNRGSCCSVGMSVLQDKAQCDSPQSDLRVKFKPPKEHNPERTLEEAVASELKAQTGQSLLV